MWVDGRGSLARTGKYRTDAATEICDSSWHFRAKLFRRDFMPAWPVEDEQRLLELIREDRLTQREIAQKIGRTEAALSSRLTIIRKRVADQG